MNDPETERPSRRRFLDVAVTSVAATVGVAALYPVARFLEPAAASSESSIVLGPEREFEPGSARAALLGDRPILVLRGQDGRFRAFVAICTHLRCVVRYAPEHQWIECACHGGRFTAEGKPLAGPIVEPLAELRVDVVDGAVVVSSA